MTKKNIIFDLDSTFFKINVLHESIFRIISSKPSYILILIYSLFKGKLYLKNIVSNLTNNFDLKKSPVNKFLFKKLNCDYKNNNYYLVSGCSYLYKKKLKKIFPFFIDVFTSTIKKNNTGVIKKKLLIKKFGNKNFTYYGDSFSDIPIWKASKESYLVSRNYLKFKLIKLFVPNLKLVKSEDSLIYNILLLFRPIHWLKSLLIFFPLIFADLNNFSFSLKFLVLNISVLIINSCAIYVFNDLLDFDNDREFMNKKNRPIASGALTVFESLFIFILLISISLLISLNFAVSSFLYLYLFGAILYSLFLKKVFIVDMIALASLFIIRIIIGSDIFSVYLSNEFLLSSFILFFVIVIVKRLSEIRFINNSKLNSSDLKLAFKFYRRPYKSSILRFFLPLALFLHFLFISLASIHIHSITNYDYIYHFLNTKYLAILIIYFWSFVFWIRIIRGLNIEDPMIFFARDKCSIICFFLFVYLINIRYFQ